MSENREDTIDVQIKLAMRDYFLDRCFKGNYCFQRPNKGINYCGLTKHYDHDFIACPLLLQERNETSGMYWCNAVKKKAGGGL